MNKTKISFMVIDNSKIKVVSATHEKHFKFKTMNDFLNLKGGFSELNRDGKISYQFDFVNPDHKQVPDFIEFEIV
jgi:hypothetical protein